jgi:energy-coupling factor transporter ATP-binding protein EcfA2
MKKKPILKKINVTATLTIVSLSCFLTSPLIKNELLVFGMRSVGLTSGLFALSRKTPEEETYLESEEKRLEQKEKELNDRYLAETQELEDWVKSEETRLASEANRVVEIERERAAQLVDDAHAEIEMFEAKNKELQERLLCYQLPKMPHGTSRVEVIAGRIVEFFYQQGILADYVDSWTENEYDLVRVKPRSGAKEQFAKLAEELQLELQLDRVPTITIVQGSVQIKVDTRCVDTRVKTDEPKVTEPSENYLAVAVSKAPSFRINGESGSGKSTLANNLIEVMKTELGGCDVTLIDPKYPLSGWEMTPRYKGIEEAFDGLQEAANLVESRLKLARDDKESGRAIRSFKPALYVVDEIDWVISHFGADAANALRVTLKVGRALNVMILYIGQTPLCSRLKMNRDDFRHSANFYIGENVPAGIDEVVHSSSLRHELESQYTLRQEGNNKFFCLVKYPGKSAFIASLPKPFIQPNSVTDKVVTASNSEQMEVNQGYFEVTPQVTPVTLSNSVNKADIAKKALKEGVSKSTIIKELWGMPGKYYAEGIALWSQLGLDN